MRRALDYPSKEGTLYIKVRKELYISEISIKTMWKLICFRNFEIITRTGGYSALNFRISTLENFKTLIME